jgi:hypothetical protein
MLRFETNPDDVFTAILETAIEYAIDQIKVLLGTNQLDDYARILVFSQKIYPPKLALVTLEKLLECHKKPELYNLNDYHYLLIYDALYLFSSIHNNGVKDSKTKKDRREASVIGPYRIEEIDFDAIVDLYFWDTDFLMTGQELFILGMEKRREMGISKEAFAISQEFLPHPEELTLKIYDFKPQKIRETEYFDPVSKTYPDYSLVE